MGVLLSGQQLNAFFQDPRFWGRGQSFCNLILRVNGQQVGPEQFQAGWDVADLSDQDIVEVIGGKWNPRGCILASNDMAEVVECWVRGVAPVQPDAASEAVPAIPSAAPEAAVRNEPKPTPAVKRPSFSLR